MHSSSLTHNLTNLELLHTYHGCPSVPLRNKLVACNMGLVRKVAYQMTRCSGEPYEDMVQIGSLGLIRAIEKFNLSLGYSFSSFAVPYIRGEMQHYLRDRAAMIRIPRRYLAQSLEDCLPQEQAEIKLARRNRSPLSLDMALSSQEDGAVCLGDLLPDARYQSFCLAQEDYLYIQQALTHLEETTRELIECVFFQDLTQTEAARRLGLSPMTVSRRISKGLQQLWRIINDGETEVSS